MAINHKEILIKSLIKDFSIETTPNVYAKYGNFADLLPKKNDVYVTYLPDQNSENARTSGSRKISAMMPNGRTVTAHGTFISVAPDLPA